MEVPGTTVCLGIPEIMGGKQLSYYRRDVYGIPGAIACLDMSEGTKPENDWKTALLFKENVMHNNKDNSNDTNRTTENGMPIPRFLGNEGKSKEVSSVFATKLIGRYDTGDESKGTIQSLWLDSIEKLAKERYGYSSTSN